MHATYKYKWKQLWLDKEFIEFCLIKAGNMTY